MKLKKLFLIIALIILFLMIVAGTVNAEMIFNPASEAVLVEADNGFFRVMAIKSEHYTGHEIIPELDVYDSKTDTKLVEGIDYEVSFSNNINAGWADATVSGIGKYENYEILKFNFIIWSRNISNDNAKLTVLTKRLEYNGQAQKPEIELICDGVKLLENKDYELIYVDNDNINAGHVYIMTSGIGNYSGTQTDIFYIDSKPILEKDITVDTSDRTYTGENIHPEVIVKSENKTLIKDVDYKVAYPDDVYFNFTGTARIEIWGIGNYKGNFTKTFNILSKDINKLSNISIDTDDKKYTGTFIKPSVELKDGDYTLVRNKDYKVSYSNNNKVGKATIKVTGLGIYGGEITKTFNILENNINNISTVNIDTSNKYFTGTTIKPKVELKDRDYILTSKDYTVTYLNNINPGTATIRITGKGIYSGEIVKTFKIEKHDITKISTISIDTSNKTYTGNEIEPKVELKDKDYMLVNNKDYMVKYSNNYCPGTATIAITGIGIYTGEIVKTFKIVQNDITKISTINVNTSNKQYTGSNITTSITLKDKDNTLLSGRDFDVSYSNNKHYGTATVTITGKGAYTGKIVKTFNIIPRKIRITSLKNTILRCVAINWEKDSSITGYEIYRSKNPNSGFSNVKTITKNSKTSNIFLAQTKGTYYYKIRTYVVVNGTKIYSDFSDIQIVKVTK